MPTPTKFPNNASTPWISAECQAPVSDELLASYAFSHSQAAPICEAMTYFTFAIVKGFQPSAIHSSHFFHLLARPARHPCNVWRQSSRFDGRLKPTSDSKSHQAAGVHFFRLANEFE